MIPQLTNIKRRTQTNPLIFTGINNLEIIADTEITNGYNLRTENLPAISPRKGRLALVENIIDPNGFMITDGKICHVDGNLFYYDNVSKGAISTNSDFKSLLNFNNNILIIPDKKYYDIAGDTLSILDGSIYVERGDLDANGIVALDEAKTRSRGYILVNNGEAITFSNTEGYTHDIYEFDKDFGFIKKTLALVGAKTLASDTENVKVVMNGSNVNAILTVNTTKEYPSEGNLPEMSNIREHYNRLFAINGKSIYASSWGDMDNWAYFQGLETDSWAIDTKSEDDFIALCNFQNHLVFFKKNSMLELYGYNPSEFQTQEISKMGCVSQQAVCEHKGILYFVSENNIFAYSGGIPRKMADKLNLKDISSASIVGKGNEIFVSLTTDEIDYQNYVYNIEFQAWLPQDTVGVLQYQNYNNEIYALTVDGEIIKFDSSEDEQVSWNLETKIFDNLSFNKTVTSRIKLKLKIKKQSLVNVYVKIDNIEWLLKGTFLNDTEQEYRDMNIVLMPKRNSLFQLKIEGKGEVMIHGEREYYLGSDV